MIQCCLLQSAEEAEDDEGFYLDCIEIEEPEPLADVHCLQREGSDGQCSGHNSRDCQGDGSLEMCPLAAAGSAASSSEILIADEDIWEPECGIAEQLETWLESIDCAAEKSAFIKVGATSQ